MIHRSAALVVPLAFLPLSEVPAQDGASGGPPVVDVTATDFEFEAPDEIRSGWSTFRLTNEGNRSHMMELGRLPEGVGIDEVRSFWSALDSLEARLAAGTIDTTEARETVARIRPDGSVEWAGGFGLLSPGRSSRMTLNLEPGTYVLLCAVRGPEGMPHSRRGMLTEFTVTDRGSRRTRPEPDVEMTVEDYRITTRGSMKSGEQTIAIHFEGREEAPGNPFATVDLIRIRDETDVDSVARWLDGGYGASPPTSFLGGSVEVPAPAAVYLTVALDPGRYAWISQATRQKGMITRFTVR